MPRYTDDSKERVRDAVDMVELVSARTELRRAGANRYQGLCPFHEERTPSFGVEPDRKLYHCFGCGVGGDVFQFVQETENVDFNGALELLADRYHVDLETEREDPRAAERRRRRDRLYALLERAAGYYERCLWDSPQAAPAREYLTGRGLSEEVLRAFRVGFAPPAWDGVTAASRKAGFTDEELLAAGLAQRSQKRGTLFDRFRGRIAFPLGDSRGRVLGFGARALRPDDQPKYLNSPEGDVYHKGRQLFGLQLARPAAARTGSVLVVEGYTDVLALHQAGLDNAVGLMGTALTEEQMAELGRLAERVELALDADAAGQEAMIRAAALAGKRRVELRVVAMPADADPADLVQREGADAIRRRVAASVPFARFRVERILATADLRSGEGRDRALAELSPVLAGMGAGAARAELERLVASRLGVAPDLIASAVAVPRPDRPAAQRQATEVLDRRERTERTFLALCIALPGEGRDALRRVRIDDHFTNPVVRRAAAHLRDHLAAPLADLPPEDGELAALIAELTVRAGREQADPTTLEIETLQLEKDRLEREIAAARASGGLDVADLAQQRSQLKERLDAAVDQAMEGAGRPGE